MAREIAERVNGMRRYQLSALVAADERDQQLERATKAGKENVQQAEELEKNQRNPETRQIVSNMRTLNERYVRSHEQVVALGKEGKLDAMRELIQGEARSAQRELAAESEKFIKIQQRAPIAGGANDDRSCTRAGAKPDARAAGRRSGVGIRYRLSGHAVGSPASLAVSPNTPGNWCSASPTAT
jgi:hypothetical protein